MQGSGMYLQYQSKLKEKTEKWSKKKCKREKIIFKAVYDLAWFNNVNNLQVSWASVLWFLQQNYNILANTEDWN